MTDDKIKRKIESISDIGQEILNETKDQKTLASQQVSKIDEIIRGMEDNQDVLYQVNCLQLLSEFVGSKVILDYLETQRVPQRILTILDHNDTLLIPHALKLFLRMNPFDVEIKYPQIIDKVCDYFTSDDQQLLDYGIDFMATIGRGGYLARKVLERHPHFRRLCLPKLGLLLINSNPLLKSRALICIKDLIEVYPGEPRTETMALSKSFYFDILPGEVQMTNRLISLCRMPILEIKSSALDLVKAIVSQSWAPKELKEIHAITPNYEISQDI